MHNIFTDRHQTIMHLILPMQYSKNLLKITLKIFATISMFISIDHDKLCLMNNRLNVKSTRALRIWLHCKL